MWDTIKSSIQSIAPAIGGVLGGPLGAAAASTLSKVLLGKPDGSEAEIASAVSAMTPEKMVELEKADKAFQIKVIELANEAEERRINDVKHAREKSESESKRGQKDWIRPSMTFSTLGSMVTLVVLLSFSTTSSQSSMSVIEILIGCLSTCFISQVGYYFGSSAGSARKTELMSK